MGGLFVYQKPDKLSMYQLQTLLLQKKAQNYTLFEQWGDQGNEWYSAVAMLADVGDNFQVSHHLSKLFSWVTGIKTPARFFCNKRRCKTSHCLSNGNTRVSCGM